MKVLIGDWKRWAKAEAGKHGLTIGGGQGEWFPPSAIARLETFTDVTRHAVLAGTGLESAGSFTKTLWRHPISVYLRLHDGRQAILVAQKVDTYSLAKLAQAMADQVRIKPPAAGTEQSPSEARPARKRRLFRYIAVAAVVIFILPLVIGLLFGVKPNGAGASPTTPPSPQALAAFSAVRNQLPKLTKPCDAAMEKSMKARSQSASYKTARAAAEACRKSAGEILALHHQSPIPHDAASDLDDAVHCYGLAYGQRAALEDRLAEVIDAQDARPSVMEGLRAEFADAIQRPKDCGLKYAAAQLKHGFESDAVNDALGKR